MGNFIEANKKSKYGTKFEPTKRFTTKATTKPNKRPPAATAETDAAWPQHEPQFGPTATTNAAEACTATTTWTAITAWSQSSTDPAANVEDANRTEPAAEAFNATAEDTTGCQKSATDPAKSQRPKSSSPTATKTTTTAERSST